MSAFDKHSCNNCPILVLRTPPKIASRTYDSSEPISVVYVSSTAGYHHADSCSHLQALAYNVILWASKMQWNNHLISHHWRETICLNPDTQKIWCHVQVSGCFEKIIRLCLRSSTRNCGEILGWLTTRGWICKPRKRSFKSYQAPCFPLTSWLADRCR